MLSKRNNFYILGGTLALVVIFMFQNCSKVSFEANPGDESLQSASLASYTTYEETLLNANLVNDRATLSSVTNISSTFTILQKPGHGELRFDLKSTQFSYMPERNFFGEDSYLIGEIQEGSTTAIERRVLISVRSIDDLPVIKTDSISFEMNSVDNIVTLEIVDEDDAVVIASFSKDDSVGVLQTANGVLAKKNNRIVYTPNPAFRGQEQVLFYAIDSQGGVSQKLISIVVGNPFRNIEPSLAIRGVGCIGCHAKVRSQFITDFGFGDPWFAAQNNLKVLGSTSLLTFGSGSMYGDHGDNWATASISGQVWVPKTSEVQPGQSLSVYLRGLEAKKAAPALVAEKARVYIGAPTASDLEKRFGITSSTDFKFIPNEVASPELAGLLRNAAGYYANVGALQCDGDVFVRGSLFLNNPVIKTKNGCRLHATGTIFLQGSPSYVNLGASNASNNTNLQLVSARAIVMGVGLNHCEKNPADWYVANNVSSPLFERLQGIWTANSHVSRSDQNPAVNGASIIAEAQKLTGFTDASCYAGGRDVHLERILLNAPMVQSRFKGAVSGVVITEAALFSLSAFSYEFDQVFKRVPVLPLLNSSDYLVVE